MLSPERLLRRYPVYYLAQSLEYFAHPFRPRPGIQVLNRKSEPIARSKRIDIIEIRNFSKSGLGFELKSKQFIHTGDRLSLKFNLDDPQKSFIYEEGIGKKIDGDAAFYLTRST